tara:strand:- start:1454 stop:1816 length:363 start_codon:yes stop_codon:yes gene_type:complete
MAKPNNLEIVNEFSDFVWVEIQTRFGDFATPKDIIYHFIERGLVEPTKLRNYLILKDFDKFLVTNKGHVTNTFYDLSIKYNLSDRQVQGIVYKYRVKFTKKNNIKDSSKDKKKFVFKYNP